MADDPTFGHMPFDVIAVFGLGIWHLSDVF